MDYKDCLNDAVHLVCVIPCGNQCSEGMYRARLKQALTRNTAEIGKPKDMLNINTYLGKLVILSFVAMCLFRVVCQIVVMERMYGVFGE